MPNLSDSTPSYAWRTFVLFWPTHFYWLITGTQNYKQRNWFWPDGNRMRGRCLLHADRKLTAGKSWPHRTPWGPRCRLSDCLNLNAKTDSYPYQQELIHIHRYIRTKEMYLKYKMWEFQQGFPVSFNDFLLILPPTPHPPLKYFQYYFNIWQYKNILVNWCTSIPNVLRPFEKFLTLEKSSINKLDVICR